MSDSRKVLVLVTAFSPNASIGLANFKIGAGVALGPGFDDTRDRWRLLVGADLYKLISGNNVELF